MKIAISGATGFIGSHLSSFLTRKGHQIVPLTRNVLQDSIQLQQAIEECEAVINLAGASINHRWTPAYKQILLDSRINTTQKIVDAINTVQHPPKLLISASAVGYYPNTGCHDEYSNSRSNSFLSELCQQWEDTAQEVNPSVRLVIPRFGVVLAPDGGAFPQLAKTARMKIAAIIGNGEQPFAWIDLTDLMRAILLIMDTPSLEGIFNFVAPQQITNMALTSEIAAHFNSWSSIKIPSGFFRLLYGEGAEFLTQGQCVVPTRLLEAGFEFQTPTITEFLKKI